MIRVLIAEDSLTTREFLREILLSDPEVQIAGEAKDGLEAVELTTRIRPNVVTMDVNMPRMNGFEATKRIMIETPTPIVIVTNSLQVRDVEVSIYALRAGALALLQKPAGPDAIDFEEQRQQFLSTIKAMSQVKVVRHWPERHQAVIPPDAQPQRRGGRTRVVAIATSTGGPAALQRVLQELPGNFPVPILVVQHMAAGFIQGLATWLNTLCSMKTKVAEDGESLIPNTVYLAPDQHHLGVSTESTVMLSRTSPIGGFRPSATYLFESVARAYGSCAVALIMTGMGKDGVEGLRALRASGGQIIAQDERSSVVFGMPGAVIQAGLADTVLPLSLIAPKLIDLV
jgi:two-component system chemotaxis response regulator CheB